VRREKDVLHHIEGCVALAHETPNIARERLLVFQDQTFQTKVRLALAAESKNENRLRKFSHDDPSLR
jgi:hypothetical protein